MPHQTNQSGRRAKLRAVLSWPALTLCALMLPSCADKTVSYERFREMEPFQGVLVRYSELEKEADTPVHSNSGPDVLVVVKDAQGITYTIPRIHTHGGAKRRLDALLARKQCDFPADLIACEDRVLYGPLKRGREHPEPNQQPPPPAAGLTIEMFRPYLTEQHNITDVMRAFPKPDFFNAGGMFIWATYKLSDGTVLVVGEHGKPSARLQNARGEVIEQFPFGSFANGGAGTDRSLDSQPALWSPRLYSDKEVEAFQERLDTLPEEPKTLDAFIKALGIDRERLGYGMVRTGGATEWTDLSHKSELLHHCHYTAQRRPLESVY